MQILHQKCPVFSMKWRVWYPSPPPSHQHVTFFCMLPSRSRALLLYSCTCRRRDICWTIIKLPDYLIPNLVALRPLAPEHLHLSQPWSEVHGVEAFTNVPSGHRMFRVTHLDFMWFHACNACSQAQPSSRFSSSMAMHHREPLPRFYSLSKCTRVTIDHVSVWIERGWFPALLDGWLAQLVGWRASDKNDLKTVCKGSLDRAVGTPKVLPTVAVP